MSGRELADQLQERAPGLPILFMSGYSGDEMQRRGLMLTGAPFIQKPFTPAAIATVVRQLLDRPRHALAT
jgi:FixJ family two-component response regulator